MHYIQPADHDHPGLGTFPQRLRLLYRAETEPTVLQASGYGLAGVRLSSITALFGANQIQVEHRFFGDSTPSPKDWQLLTIKQSAADFHRIAVAFKQIFTKRWVSMGGSKGAMTGVYHRRFYPDDLDGTVAQCAPQSFSTADERYITFVEGVGGDEFRQCREDLQRWQIGLLRHRGELVPLITGNFTHLGSADVAFEHAVTEASYIFWQYILPGDQDKGCSRIPVNGTPMEQFEFLQKVNGVSNYSDEAISGAFGYTLHAAKELGSPAFSTAHLQALRRYEFKIEQYAPKDVPYTYDPHAMRDVDRWVRNQSHHILFIYGEFDPWTAGEFTPNAADPETYKFYAPRFNHGSGMYSLSAADRETAMQVLSRWMNKPPVLKGDTPLPFETLEEWEFKHQRAGR